MNRGSSGLRRSSRAVGAAALLVASLGLGGAWPAAAIETENCTPQEGFTDCRIFDHSGAAVDFQVPVGVDELDVRAWGMGGDGNPFANGGAGAYVAGELKVTPGEHLTVNVGGWYQGRKFFGDALGGEANGSWGERGGASSGVRASDGSPLLIAAGGGGGGLGVRGAGRGGSGGAPDGLDAGETDLGGKGAKGAQGGAAGGEGASAGADAAQGGAGGAGGTEAGGGGGGYAGGGGGAAKTASGDSGSGAGGSSYADAERMSDVRMLTSPTSTPAARNDPFWTADPYGELSPVLSGVGEGGPNQRGGDGRVVFQWNAPEGSTPEVAELTRESGDNQNVLPSSLTDPLVVVTRDKDGKPLAGRKVTFTLEDPDQLGLRWDEEPTEVWTDDQGRAQSPAVITGKAEGDFTVRAASGDASTTFTAHVREGIYAIEITGGDEQQAKPGEAFADPLSVKIAKPGVPVADIPVKFSVEGDAEGAPTFEGGEPTATVSTNGRGEVSAPELTAGDAAGTYTVVATVDDATARFTLKVVAAEEGGASPSPSPSESSDTTASASDDSGDDSGSLALTGAAGIGTLAGAAAALTALGWAALRLRTRFRAQD
ncbi:glycine-rich protein [Streptomyces sp. Act143]|uniref:glycine-rich protein n=1 Tax=Streptomyces sp. Act143 TaxID=2200760 RepID=UPI0015E821AE|nr:glycine-rich protein [Streptomyces sp. Act143]